MLEIRLIGPIQVCPKGQIQNLVKTKKGQWLMALLALRIDRECSRDWLAECLWPEQDLAARRSYLSHTLVEVRKSLAADARCILASDPRHLRLNAAEVSVDLTELDLAIASDPQRAIKIYSAPLFEGCEEPWAIEARAARQARLCVALERLAETSSPSEAAGFYRQLIRIEPFHEGALRGLMSSLFTCGHESEAIKAYREFKLRLHRELNAVPSAETEATYARIARQPTVRGDRQHVPGHQLPSPLSELVGRETELSAIAALMEVNRLVTLTGFGGSGKTRLAIETGRRLLPMTESGVWFVDFSALTNPVSVAETVGETLGIGQSGDAPWDTRIVRSIGSRRLALILDNCEHVVEPAARLASALLGRCPNLRILATSREPLGVPGERQFSVPPLDLPLSMARDRKLTANRALEASAVRLFQDRARQVRPEFEVTDVNAPDVAEICRRLDGIPLAIEMAAACIGILSPADILSRLGARLQLLHGGRRLTAPRQQTLQALIDWSYLLLDESEQVMFSRLSVFSGGWTAEAADRVVSGGVLADSAVLDVLGALVAKSLVQADVGDRGTRFRLLEIVRDYAAERLQDSGEAESMRDRHYVYFLSLARQGEGWRMGLAEAAWFDACDVDYDNLRSATEWGFLQGIEQALAIAAALSPLWHRHGHMSEGLAVLERALALPAPDPASSDRLAVMKACGHHLGSSGSRSDTGISILEEMVALARKKGDRQELATALEALGSLSHEHAAEALHEALRVIGDEGSIGRAQQCLNLLALRALRSEYPETGEPWPDHDLSAAEQYLERSLALCGKHGDLETEAWAYHLLGVLKDKTSGPVPALSLFSRADRLFRTLGIRSGLLYVTWARTEAYVSMSDFRGARDSASEMLALALDFGNAAAEYAAYLLNAEILDQVGDAAGAEEMIRRGAIYHLEHSVPFAASPLLLRASEMCGSRELFELAARIHGALPNEGRRRIKLVADEASSAEYNESREHIRASLESAIGASRVRDLADEGRRLTEDQAVELVRDAFS